MINVGVIGSGYWGTKLISEYSVLPNKRSDVKLAAIADVSPQRLLHIKDTFALPDTALYTDYQEILDNPEINGVHIATSNETHFEIASKAIAKGKHVLLEKPMSLNSSDAFKLARLAEKNASILLIGHIFRFNNSVNKLKELIEKKIVNKTRYIELRWSSCLTPLPDRDVIFDLAPHPIDILNHVFEEWPLEVYVKAHSYERNVFGREEVAFATLSFPGNILVSIFLELDKSWKRERSINIINQKNSIEVKVVDQTITLYEKGIPKEIPVKQNNTIEAEINHFVECIKNGDPPINSALTGLMNVKVLESMRKSIEEDKIVSLYK